MAPTETEALLTGLLNQHLAKIEQQLEAKLKPIMDGIDAVRGEMESVRQGLQQTRVQCDQLQTKVTSIEQHLLENEQLCVPDRVEDLERKVAELELRAVDAEDRNRRNNLVLHGLRPKKMEESYQDVSDLYREWSARYLGLELHDLDIVRAHRLPSKKMPKPIIVQFLHWKTKERTLARARLLKGTKFGLNQDYSRETRNVRAVLLKHAKAAREQKREARVVYTTLWMDGQRYRLGDQGTLQLVNSRGARPGPGEEQPTQSPGRETGQRGQGPSDAAGLPTSQQTASSDLVPGVSEIGATMDKTGGGYRAAQGAFLSLPEAGASASSAATAAESWRGRDATADRGGRRRYNKRQPSSPPAGAEASSPARRARADAYGGRGGGRGQSGNRNYRPINAYFSPGSRFRSDSAGGSQEDEDLDEGQSQVVISQMDGASTTY